MMCDNLFFDIDTVVYGSNYTENGVGPPGLGNPEPLDLPIAGTDAMRMQGSVCLPCVRDNAADYDLDDVNDPDTNNPRNNAGTTGDVTATPPDSDGDGVPDAGDNCPARPNPDQTLPSWSVPPSGDPDCDGAGTSASFGFLASETFVGTDPNDGCADTTTPNDERGPAFGEPLSPWVPDTNDNGLVQIGDLLSVGAALNTSPPNPNYTNRFDWNGNGSVSISDLLTVGAFLNKPCAS
jgi:hypothetical protein